MKKLVYKYKNLLMIISLFLILVSTINNYIIKLENISEILMLISSIIGVLPIFVSAYSSLKVKLITIDLLVVIAVFGALFIKNYEESAIVTFLFLFGSFLEQKTINKTKKAIKSLTDLSPLEANVLKNNNIIKCPIEDVLINDLVVVKTGEKIPVDGIIVEGSGYLNESYITGEAIPILKQENDQVFASSLLDDGYIVIKATAVLEDTTFGKIIEMVTEAQDKKSKTWQFIDKFSTYYTPLVLFLGIIIGIIFKDIELAITVLVLGCPGALVIGIPISNVSGIGISARYGILFKGSETISDLAKSEIFVFDKTGTLTKGFPQVIEMIHFNSDIKLIESYYKSLEATQTHPIAKAIINHLNTSNLMEVSKVEVIKGKGLVGIIENKKILLGNSSLMKDFKININQIENIIKKFEDSGYTYVILASENEVLSISSIGDQLKDNLKNDLYNLSKLGVKETYILSGDNQGAVNKIKSELNMTKGIGGLLPQDKKTFIDKLQSEGKKVVFIGDGINDAPSLASASVGISIKGGTDIAIETSDVVLMNTNLTNLVTAKMLAKKILNNMRQNIFIAVFVVIILLYQLIFSSNITMSIGMLIHELSILIVILNGMRLLKIKIKE